MKSRASIAIGPVLILLGLVVTCPTISAKADKTVGGAEWKIRMREMLSDVLVLFPYAFDEEKFASAENAPTVKAALTSLGRHADALQKHASHADKGAKLDPSFAFISDSFQQEIALAQDALQDSHRRGQAQISLRSAISKCMMCHTQSNLGPELKLDQFQSQIAGLSNSDAFFALISTRQFDRGLERFDKIVADAKVTKPTAKAFDRDARAALAVIVRVKRDPKGTMALVDRIIASEAGTEMLKNDLKKWKASVAKWTNEKPSDFKSDRAVFDEAKRLVAQARSVNEAEGGWGGQDVELLRASSLLHDLLTTYPNSSYRAESFLLLASNYDSLAGFTIWNMAEEYLGACVRENPHSEVGEKCFKEYQDKVTMGYTGSAGMDIPKAVRDHLSTMKALASRPR